MRVPPRRGAFRSASTSKWSPPVPYSLSARKAPPKDRNTQLVAKGTDEKSGILSRPAQINCRQTNCTARVLARPQHLQYLAVPAGEPHRLLGFAAAVPGRRQPHRHDVVPSEIPVERDDDQVKFSVELPESQLILTVLF